MRTLPAIWMAFALSACSLAHRGESTPQQQFLDTLNRGNAAQASQLWLNMSGEDRQKFERGEGIKPNLTPEQTKRLIIQSWEQKQAEEGAQSEEGAQLTVPQIGNAGLESLPEFVPGSAAQFPDLSPQPP
jgi:hypothetical protein